MEDKDGDEDTGLSLDKQGETAPLFFKKGTLVAIVQNALGLLERLLKGTWGGQSDFRGASIDPHLRIAFKILNRMYSVRPEPPNTEASLSSVYQREQLYILENIPMIVRSVLDPESKYPGKLGKKIK